MGILSRIRTIPLQEISARDIHKNLQVSESENLDSTGTVSIRIRDTGFADQERPN